MSDRRYIVARNYRQAFNSAFVDAGWRPKLIGPSQTRGWIDHEGCEVVYISDVWGLRGVRDPVVYEGYGWRDRKDASVISELANAGQIDLMPIPQKAGC